jgi:voltage-gated potassium channel
MKIIRFLNWQKASKPHINLNSELYSQLAPFRLPLILTVMVMMIGTIGYVLIDDFPLMDAIYQTGITFTTVGFGEISEISNAGRLFTINLIILGFLVFSFSIGILVEVLNKGHLLSILKERSMLYKIARLKHHYVICYHNNETAQVTKQFKENHIPFVVIDPRPGFDEIAKEYDYPYFIQGEPHSQEAILKSHLSSAKGLITLSENMADNIAQIASTRLYEEEIGRNKPKRAFNIITSADNISDMEKLKKLGANSVISASKLMAQRITVVSTHPEMENLLENFMYKKDTPLDIEEIVVSKNSWVIYKKLKDTHIRDYINVSIVGITNSDGIFVPMPKGDLIIGSTSKLLVIGTSEGIADARALLRKQKMPEELKYV